MNVIALMLQATALNADSVRHSPHTGFDTFCEDYHERVSLLLSRIHRTARVQVFYCKQEGDALMSEWIKHGMTFVAQRSDDVRSRMKSALAFALLSGAGKVLFLKEDCPYIDQGIVQGIWERLEQEDLVVGPCDDGGCYCVGVRANRPEVMHGIPWGCDRMVAGLSMQAHRMHLRLGMLPEMPACGV